jgi:DNA-binding response OmpR family regulator
VDPDRVEAPGTATGPSTVRRVLVIEDDPTLSDVVARYLRRDGFAVEVRGDGPGGLERALDWLPDLVVLDLMLPGMDGLEVCDRLRAAAPIPVVMLTARAEEDDRVLGLETGADDYVTKPFSPRELTARINAVLRRAAGPLGPSADPTDAGRRVLVAGEIEVDTVAREVRRAGEEVHLTAKEYDLLVHLMRHPRVAFARTDLLEQVWGWTYGDAATVTVHVRRLRTKVEQDPGTPRHLVTVTGGYRFEP